MSGKSPIPPPGHRRADLSNVNYVSEELGKNKGYDYARNEPPEPQGLGTYGC